MAFRFGGMIVKGELEGTLILILLCSLGVDDGTLFHQLILFEVKSSGFLTTMARVALHSWFRLAAWIWI